MKERPANSSVGNGDARGSDDHRQRIEQPKSPIRSSPFVLVVDLGDFIVEPRNGRIVALNALKVLGPFFQLFAMGANPWQFVVANDANHSFGCERFFGNFNAVCSATDWLENDDRCDERRFSMSQIFE